MTAAKVATALGGARREGRNWRCRCPVNGGHSLTLRDGRSTLLLRCWAGRDTREVLAELRRAGLLAGGSDGVRPPAPANARGDDRDDTARRSALARRIWAAATDARGTPVERYLSDRGISIPVPSALRWAPSLGRPDAIYAPAMVARVEGLDGELIGIHRTWLDRDEHGQWHRRDRASLGPVGGGAVRLAPVAETLLIGEAGFEEAIEIIEKAGLDAIIYTSPSHTEDRPRWRVLCPFSTELPPDRWQHMMGRLNGLFHGAFSSESCALSQSYYFGTVNGNPAHRVEIVTGIPIDRCDEFDEIWQGKPDTLDRRGKGNGDFASGPADEDALLSAIVSSESYHVASTRLVGKWAQQGVPFLEAQKLVEAAFDRVEASGRDARWQQRRADVPRIVRDIYGKEAEQQDARSDGATPPEFSDEALALQFAKEHAAELRYVAAIGKWHIWTGLHWHADDTMQAFDFARGVCRNAAALIPPEHTHLPFVVASARTVAAVERLARADRRHATAAGQWDRLLNGKPYYTDADLDAWIEERLSPPLRNSSERGALAAASPASSSPSRSEAAAAVQQTAGAPGAALAAGVAECSGNLVRGHSASTAS